MKDLLAKYIKDKKILILGFGREGRSTFRLIKKYFPGQEIAVADSNMHLNIGSDIRNGLMSLYLGADYQKHLQEFDVIFKSPGVVLEQGMGEELSEKILTQTSLFLERYAGQTIGVTGTKGKSTTASLIRNIFETAGMKSVLVGNIGVPPFDLTGEIDDETTIAFELSAHQLQRISHAPHIAVLLNIFTEHLDYFSSFEAYRRAKLNIARFQTGKDYFIYALEDAAKYRLLLEDFSGKKLPFSVAHSSGAEAFYHKGKFVFGFANGVTVDAGQTQLRGKHNLQNILAAATACLLKGVPPATVQKGMATFVPLKHRLEYLGNFGGIDFVNDSISTIPESTVEALKTVENVDTLILGGFDRGVDFSLLIDYLTKHPVANIFLTGPAGQRMFEQLNKKEIPSRMLVFNDYGKLPQLIRKYTAKGKACLLSPAASSYDRFGSFEERGDFFKNIAESF
jgi:UDP-N-acetylmuramoylalanine--D-glutamate ligase